MPRVLIIVALLVASTLVQAEVRPHGLFGDHMVLQCDTRISIWGWADPGEEVTVAFAGQRAQTQAGTDGKWRVDLEEIVATAEPQVLTISGQNTVTFEDVLVGDVWLCSGQSNMEYGIFNVAKKEEVVDLQIRTFCVTKSAALAPLDQTVFVPGELVWDTLTGHWQKENPAGSWGGFSAVGYLFGKEIRAVTQQPVGLIGSYWGGSPIQAWVSRAALEAEPKLSHYAVRLDKLLPEQTAKFPVVWEDYVRAMRTWDAESYQPYAHEKVKWIAAVEEAKKAGKALPSEPEMAFPRPRNPGNVGTTASIFNGMIHPILPFAIKGVIWYQGEANVGNREYDLLFTTLIKDWRQRWGQGDFPFLFVQLAGYGKETKGNWAGLRDQQKAALTLPHTAMAVAIDVGERDDIHPPNKLPVAQRLAVAAQHLAYGKDVVYIGPTYESIQTEGQRLRVTFKNVGTGLVISTAPQLSGSTALASPLELRGFEIAGKNQQWYVAKAMIEGGTVLVSSDQVAEPLAVRYAWGDYPACDLYNKEGLPGIPFLIDDWDSKAVFSSASPINIE